MPEVKKGAGGRPTDYRPEFCQAVDEYLKTCVDESYNVGMNSKLRVRLPKREEFAEFLGHPRSTIDLWANAHPEFMDALTRLDSKQKGKLIDEGLAGNYNPTIAKLLLSANHDMREKSDQDITSKGEKIEGIAVEFVRAPKNPDPGSV